MLKNWEAEKCYEIYTYKTVEDLKLHMLYMKRKGYVVWDFSEEELYAEYQMADIVMGGTEINEEGDEDFV